MLSVLAFLLAIGILVTIHEFGHYLAARACHVHVLRFSIGFGRALWQYQRSPQHTAWVIAALPLGGYVQMLDKRDPTQSALPTTLISERHQAFNDRHPWQKMLIVLAGPLANLLLAMVLYWALLWQGETGLKPILGPITTPSLASTAALRAGDQVIAFNGETVRNWQVLHGKLLEAALEGARVTLTTRSANGDRHHHTLDLQALKGQVTQDVLGRLGLSVAMPPVRPRVGKILPDSAAAQGGLHAADTIQSVNGVAINDWSQFVKEVRASPQQKLNVVVLRDQQTLSLTLIPELERQDGQSIGKLGAGVDMHASNLAPYLVTTDYTILQAGQEAIHRLGQTITFTLKMLGHLLAGEASLKLISGPVSIAGAAGDSAAMGWQPYIGFLALLSISIAVMNLLPIPVLDGGHFMYHMAEWITGKPLPTRAIEIGQRLGFAMLGTLMMVALFNDINRVVAG